MLPAVELQPGIATRLRVPEPSQQKDGRVYLSDAGQCPGKPVRSARVSQPQHNRAPRRVAVPQRTGHAHQSVPLFADQFFRQTPFKQRFQFAVLPVLAQLEVSLVAEPGQPGLQR